MQSQPDHPSLRYSGPLDCFRQSVKADGILGLYRGISIPLVGAAAETSSLFVFERVGRETLVVFGLVSRDKGFSVTALWASGAFAGVCASFVLTPIELVKCKIQVPAHVNDGAVPALRPLAVVREVFRYEGLRGFWRGQMGTLIREGGGSAAWFGTKETVTSMFYTANTRMVKSRAEKDKILSMPLPLWQQAVAGASAGVSYNFLFFPADTIKSRIQSTAIGTLTQKRGLLEDAVMVWRRHGIRGLYRGCGITCLQSVPSSAFIFIIYDGLKQQLPMPWSLESLSV